MIQSFDIVGVTQVEIFCVIFIMFVYVHVCHIYAFKDLGFFLDKVISVKMIGS